MQNKASWFIKIWDDGNPEIFGIGECGPLPGLSVDARDDFEEVLTKTLTQINQLELTTDIEKLNVHAIISAEFPSIIFGIETALLDLANGGKRMIFDNNPFSKGQPISINGLIWMGDMDFMMDQISKKIGEGFNCIKLKVGGLDFDRECDVLDYIRRRFFRENITIRLDANGAFKIDDVLFRLDQLSKYKIESIEQPIKPGLPEMEELCRKSPIPIAFDEELIGIHSRQEKQQLLDRLKPKYIVLKPSLHGGLSGCKEWIALAEDQGIGWWITSALESNIGLNAICQFTATYPINMPQGLGTGAIYDNNISSPLKVERGNIFYDSNQSWSSELI
jgi:o-succinylbenzoate synthase